MNLNTMASDCTNNDFDKKAVEFRVADISCTSCHSEINIYKQRSVFQHPILRVLMCKKCFKWYSSGEIERGEDGADLQCRWCGDGGDVFCCNNCSNVFCKDCITINLGEEELKRVESTDKWFCYVCDSEPLCCLRGKYDELKTTLDNGVKVTILSEDEDEEDVIKSEFKGQRMSEKELNHWDVKNLQLSLMKQETAKHNLQTFEESISSLVPISRTLSNSLSYALSQVKKIDLAHENVTMGKLDDIYNKINSNLHNLLSAFSSVKSSKGSKTRSRKKGNKKGGMLKNGREVHIENGCSNSKSKEPPSQGSQSETPRIKLTISKKSLGLTSDGANNVSTFGSTREEIINGDEDDNVGNIDDEDDNIVPAVAEDIDKDDEEEEEDDDDDDDDAKEKESNDEASDDKEVSGDSSGDEYNPKKDIRDIKEQMKVKKEKGKQPKTKTAKRSLQKIKEKLRLKKLKVQLEKSKKGSKEGEDGEEEEEDDDGEEEGSNDEGKEGSAKKKSDGKKKKKKNKKKDGEEEDGDSDEHCSKRRKNILDKKLQKFQKSKAEGEGDSDDDNKDDIKDDKFDDDIKRSIRSVSRLLKQKIVRGKAKHAGRRPAKSTGTGDADDDKDNDKDDDQDADDDDGDKDDGENSNIGQLPDDSSELRNEYSAISDDQPNVEDSMLGEDKSRSPGVEKRKKSRITDDLFMDDSNGNMDVGDGGVDDEKEVHTSLRDYDLCNDQFDLEDQMNEEQVDAADDDDDGGDFDNSDDMIDKVVEHCTSKKKKKFEKFRKLMNSDDEDGNMYDNDDNEESNENNDNAGDEDSKSDDGLKSSKKKKRDRLLAASLLSSDDEQLSSKKGKKKDSEGEDDVPKKKRSRKKKDKSDDEDDGEGLKAIMEESDEDTKKKKRRRVRMESSSEDDDKDGSSSDDMQSPSSGKKRKKIHKIITSKKLSKETIDAAKAEEERKKRIEERQKLFNQVTVEDSESPMKCPITTKLVLEMDPESNEPLIEVHKKVICKLKPHQVEAVKFMWSCCIESLEMLKKEEGSGCILAHCMGLGKTLSVISFVHTVLRFRKHTSLKTCLVLTPLNTILNWDSEFERWLKGAQPLDVYEMSTVKDNWSRSEVIKNWREGGGVLIMGYDMFRTLSQLTRVKNKKQKVIITEGLLSPGPDIVVCDEGHVLKNDTTGLSKACNKIKTRRRIVLTGTPLQNNLSEYHCMVNFVKPNLLGTRKEFLNRFVNPITNGQCSDSTPRDVKIMKNRAHVLHETLNGCVQRRDYSSLTKYLLPKLEYVILIRLSKVQVDLYQAYLQRSTSGETMYGPIRGSRIFTDYQNLMKIWTHPWVLKLDEIRQECRKLYKDDNDSFIDDSNEESFFDSEESALDAGSGSEDDWRPRRKTRNSQDSSKAPEQPPPKKKKKKSKFSGSMDEEENEEKEDDKEVVKGWKSKSRRGGDEPIEESPLELEDVDKEDRISSEWWADFLKSEDEYDTHISGKLMLLAEILKLSESIGDKVLLFSQSLLSLDLIEKFLQQWDEDPKKKLGGTQGWCKGYDYIRMDGSTSAQNRKEWTEMFNDETNPKVRLFLISTKAGSLGINLVAANRVIIFDASWNPTHDVQSIFRVYRFGQTKPVYVYRFLAQGTMEEKIYERQVLKQSLAQRVIDEHQIERHFTSADLRELYTFKPDVFDPQNKKPTPKLPNDRLLAELLKDHDEWVVQYHEHDSLLENRPEEELTEEERKAAWEEYELEKKGLLNRHNFNFGPNMMGQQGDMFSNTYTDVQKFIHTLFLQNPGITQDELNEKARYFLHLQMTQQQNYMQHQQRERERLMRLQQASLLRQRIANLQNMGPITIDEEPSSSSSSHPPNHQSTPPVSRS